MSQSKNYSQLYKKAETSSIIASILIMATIMIIFFFTSSEYSIYVEKTEESKSLQTRLDWLKKELASLNEKKSKVKNDAWTQKSISQLAGIYREDQILNQIYVPTDWISVHDINMDKWQKLPNWLSLANISISVDAKWIDDLNKYIDYLTSNSWKVRFVIKSFSVPINTENLDSAIAANLNLGMYYYEK